MVFNLDDQTGSDQIWKPDPDSLKKPDPDLTKAPAGGVARVPFPISPETY